MHLRTYVTVQNPSGNVVNIPIGYTPEQVSREWPWALEIIGDHCWDEEAKPELKSKDDELLDKTVKQLGDIADHRGVDLTGISRKADIIDAIQARRGVLDDIADDEEDDSGDDND